MRGSRESLPAFTSSDDATAVSLDSKTEGSSQLRSTKKSPVKKSASKRKSTSARKSTRVTSNEPSPLTRPRRGASRTPAKDTLSFSISPVPQVSRSRLSSMSPPEEPLPVFSGTDRERLETSQSILSTSHAVHAPAMDKDASRGFHRSLNSVYKFVSSAIESRGAHGGIEGEPAALYVSGVPGVGKTSGVMWCGKQAIDNYKSICGDESSVSLVYVKSGSLHGHSNPRQAIFDEIASCCGVSSAPTSKKKFESMLTKRIVVLVMDEIDTIVAEGSVPGRNSNGSEAVLRNFLDWAKDPKVPLCLIGISNCSSGEQFNRIHTIGSVRRPLPR